MSPLVSFIIPVRNDAERLRRCLKSIKANRYPSESLEIVVADNGSTDESVKVAQAEGATVLVVPGVRVGALRNQAARAAQGDVLAFVDADHEIAPEWVSSAVSVLAKQNIAAVGAACRPPSPATWVQRLYDTLRRHRAGTYEVDWLGSGNMAVRRVSFELAGGFDTSLETCEDVDLCRKLRSNGSVLMADSRLENIHYGDPRTLLDVFFGELWRGRDNVRVSLRPPRTWRTLISAGIPVVHLLALATLVGGLASLSDTGVRMAGLAAVAVLAVIGLRMALMVQGGARLRALVPAFAVAAAYECGRALALGARFGYGLRRSKPGA